MLYHLSALALVCIATPTALASDLYSPLVASKILVTATSRPSNTQYPQNTDTYGKTWQYTDTDYWTSGFFPATLYAMNDRSLLCRNVTTDKTNWVGLARAWSAALTTLEANNTVGHDVGFISIPFANELAINPKNQTAIDAVNRFATDLANRFNPIVGCTRSWDTADLTDFQVIIDNMMNLEVLFVSARLTGNKTLVDIAISHADTTMKNHIRPDGSTYHVVEYNATTGVVIRRRTAQGYADNSTWARGQAWGLYGYANMYKHTRQERYIVTARRLASLFVTRTPKSGIVPWDFDAPVPAPADTSAATIAATGLLLLSKQEMSLRNFTGAKHWSDAAMSILGHTVDFAWKPEWQSLLSNGTINKPSNNFDTGIVYGDYYLVEAGNQLVSMGLAEC